MCGIWDWQSAMIKDLNDSQDPKHTLFCREILFVAIYALFSDTSYYQLCRGFDINAQQRKFLSRLLGNYSEDDIVQNKKGFIISSEDNRMSNLSEKKLATAFSITSSTTSKIFLCPYRTRVDRQGLFGHQSSIIHQLSTSQSSTKS